MRISVLLKETLQGFHRVTLPVLLIAGYSCIDDVPDIKLPPNEPKLVIFSAITPDDSIRVNVHKSNPIFSESVDPSSEPFPPVTNAVVSLSNESGEQVTIPYRSSDQLYSIGSDQFSIQEGMNYYLTISAPGFKTITASTTIPDQKAEISSIVVDTIINHDYYDYYESEIQITGEVLDNFEQENYYRVQVYYYTCYSYDYPNEAYPKNSREFFSDAGNEGQNIGFTYRFYYTDWDSIGIYVYSMEEEYYNYYRTLLDFSTENPFSEPVPVYSNIKNGLGIFGSYLITSKTILPDSEK